MFKSLFLVQLDCIIVSLFTKGPSCLVGGYSQQHWEILYLLFSIVSGIKMEKFYGRPLPTVYISNTQMYSSDVHELEMQLGDYFWKWKADLDSEIIYNFSSNWILPVWQCFLRVFFVKYLKIFLLFWFKDCKKFQLIQSNKCDQGQFRTNCSIGSWNTGLAKWIEPTSCLSLNLANFVDTIFYRIST